MVDYVQDGFDEFVPGAGDKAELFLQVIRDEATKQQIGLDFKPSLDKGTGIVSLQAKIQFGGFSKGSPMTLIVHANRLGDALQVGWQLTEKGLGDFGAMFAGQRHAHSRMQSVNLKPENQRQLTGLIGAFHKLVFMKVLQMLVSAVEAENRPSGGSGFLGS